MSLNRYRLSWWRRSPRPQPDTSLEQVFAGCLQWAYDSRSRFFPFAPSGHPSSLRVKAFGELAFCLRQVLQAAPDRLRARAAPLAHWVLDTVAANAFGSLLAEEPQLLPMLEVLEALEAELGAQDRLAGLPTRHQLAIHSDARRVDGWPFQALGTARTCGASQPEIEQLFRRTLVCHDPQLACLSDLDTYAITHAIFHASGAAGEPPPWLDGETAAAMRWTLAVLLGMTVRSDDLDLLAELLICHAILGCPEEDLARVAWRRLARAQDRTGFVPGPEYDAHHLAGLGSREQAELVFLTAYHTTLATLLAAAHFLARHARRTGSPEPR